MRLRSLLVPAILVAAACGDSGTNPPSVPANAILVEADSIGGVFDHFVASSGVERRARLVVEDAEAWTTLWQEISRGVGPPPPVPTVDFDTHVVIVASMGLRHTGGYRIMIESVHQLAGDLYVVVNEQGHRGCGVTLAETAPLAGVVVPRVAGRVVFLERTSVHVCGG